MKGGEEGVESEEMGSTTTDSTFKSMFTKKGRETYCIDRVRWTILFP